MQVSAYDRRLPTSDYEAGAALLRSLASPIRLAIVDELSDGERCVHELMDTARLPQTQVSQHLRLLKDAGLVIGHRRGREVVYSLVDGHAADIVHTALTQRGSRR